MKNKFKSFLESSEIYMEAESYWHILFDEYNELLDPENKWTAWFENVWGNGTKKMDGNPILSRWNEPQKRGLRVIQESPEFEGQFHFGAWMDKFDDEIDELVVSCILSDETEALARRLINLYVVENLDPTTMQRIIDELFSDVKN